MKNPVYKHYCLQQYFVFFFKGPTLQHLPGSSKEAGNLVSKACIVGVFHDGHQLNAVITWRTEHKHGLKPGGPIVPHCAWLSILALQPALVLWRHQKVNTRVARSGMTFQNGRYE